MGFYEEMAAVATELLTEFDQGGTLSRTTTAAPAPETPWLPGESTTVTHTLRCAVSAVTVDQANAKYIDGTVITSADLVVTCAVPEIVPAMTDTLTIDGLARTIKKIVQIPAAGVSVAFKIFIAG